jgi:hypothetical protein
MTDAALVRLVARILTREGPNLSYAALVETVKAELRRRGVPHGDLTSVVAAALAADRLRRIEAAVLASRARPPKPRRAWWRAS